MFRPVCLWLFCTGLALNQTAPAAAPPEVTVGQPVVREVTDYGDFIGRAQAAHSVTICPRVTGYLAKVRFKAGDAVRQGELLFEVDPRPYQAALEKHQAECQLAEAQLKLAATTFARNKQLATTTPGSVGEPALDQAQAGVTTAEAAVKAARAGLESARLQLEFTRIVAPIGGKIGRPAVDAGNLVTADSTSLATIVSTDPVYVCFDVDERTTLQLRRKALENRGKNENKAGLPVACALADEAGYPRRGVVDFANNVVDPATGTLLMRAVLPNADGLILPGMFVRVRLTLSEPYKAVLVSERAVMSDRGNKQVFVVTAGNVVERRAVKVGPLDDGMRVVREGLTVEDNVVVSGVQRLRPGMTVSVKKAAAPER
jgi:RND family efflux transporter MFP subunit